MRKVLLGLGAIVVAAGAAYALFVGFALSPACDLSELAAHPSPDGKFVSSVFRKDCGATTDYVTGVTMRRAEEPFSSDSAHAVLIIEGDVPVEIRWAAGDMLEILVPPSARVFSKKDKWNDIGVELNYGS
jgi:hypothetical protein